MKEQIELILNPDGSVFLNFWDWAHGNDVIGEMKSLTDTEINVDGKIVTFNEFLQLVVKSVESRTI
jgi:hypothetical protein